MSAPPLTVEFAGQHHHVERRDTPTSVTFGRGAELDIDCNPFLHRQVGRLVTDGELWWVECLGEWTPLWVASDGRMAQLTRDASVPLTNPETVIRFDAGNCNYELRVHIEGHPGRPDHPLEGPPPGSTATFRPIDLPLNDEQRLLILALAEARLRSPNGHTALPSNLEAANRLGWSTSKFNRKLDWLCQRLHRMGVAGMRGGDRRRANDRRRILVEHMISHHYVAAADLALLDEHDRRHNSGESPQARRNRSR